MNTQPKKEIYFSIDIEADGPIPAQNSMLNFGCVALDEYGTELSTFERNLSPLEGAVQDKKCMEEFWDKHPEAWEYVTKYPSDPFAAMGDYACWIEEVCKEYNGKAVCVAYPAGFDFMFIYWYLMKFVGRSPFGFQALDIKSYACCKTGIPFKKTIKRNMPKDWFPDMPHTHKGLDDAREQGQLFINILNSPPPN